MVELDQSNYVGYKTNLAVNAGIGYQFDASSRLRADALAGQFNGNNENFFYQTQMFEGSISYEYNIVHVFDPKSSFKLNGRAGLGAGLMNSNLYDIVTRQRAAEIPNPTTDGRTYSLNTFILLGLNAGIPLTNKLDLNVGYAHRVLLFQPWLDAFNSKSFDMYGFVTAGLTYYLKSDRDKSKIEVDPKKYAALKLSADSAEIVNKSLTRQAEKVASLEMSNQEKDVQIDMLNQKIDSLNTMPRVAAAVAPVGNATGNTNTSLTTKKASTDLGTEMYRIVIVSSFSEAEAQKFINRSKLNKDDMQIAYIAKLDTYRVIYKSANSLDEAKTYRAEARKYYSNAWIVKF
ncbi:MAG: hypothetical protein DA405_00895 [Bacteroidetes bacterium]|nr:MAG: hypothetical protein DA405_00895 [Bacteroidota bacterium]